MRRENRQPPLGSCESLVARLSSLRWFSSLAFQAKHRADRERVPCKIRKVYQVFPYNLMADYVGNSKQPFWHMSMIRNPVDRVSAAPLLWRPFSLQFHGISFHNSSRSFHHKLRDAATHHAMYTRDCASEMLVRMVDRQREKNILLTV